jgi:hypothetical protein
MEAKFMIRRLSQYRFFKQITITIVPMILLGSLIVAAVSCQNFSGPVKGEVKIVVTPCDTVNVSYTKTIQPLLKENCYSCHSNVLQTVGVNMEVYANVKSYADATLLVGVTSQLPGYAQMPQGGVLSDCNKRIIRAWVNQGAKNN